MPDQKIANYIITTSPRFKTIPNFSLNTVCVENKNKKNVIKD